MPCTIYFLKSDEFIAEYKIDLDYVIYIYISKTQVYFKILDRLY